MSAATSWLASNYLGGDEARFSPHGRNVAELLWTWARGIYHMEPAALRKAEWSSARLVQVWVSGDLATFDYDELTRLVFLAHDHSVRLAIKSHGPGRIALMFWPRTREGDLTRRHPTLEQAVATFRARNPAPVGAEAATAAPATPEPAP